MMVSMIIMMIILVILMMIMTKMTKKHTTTVKFELKIAILRTVTWEKKGAKNLGTGRPPLIWAMLERKRFFSFDVFPNADGRTNK